ncbi:MAG: hypothetical protein GEV06_06260 [Luteitalea sp.]|nr:hypothetical protein [Luteitalea sp.]
MQARIPYRAAIVISAALAMLASGAPNPQVVSAASATRAQEPASRPVTEAAPGGEQGSTPAPPSEASIAKAKEVLQAVNEAVGGAAVADLRSLAFEADTRRVFGERQMSSTFTMRVLFPDKFQRVEETERPDGTPGGTVTLTVNGQESWMEREGGGGFRGRGRGAREGGSGEAGAAQGGPGGPAMGGSRGGGRGRAMHGEFYRALLGVLPSAAPLAGLTLAHVGEAQAPNGQTADVLDVAGDGFKARVFVDRQTHLLLMMTYQAPSFRGMRRMGPQRGGSEDERRKALEEIRRERQAQGPPPLVETQLFFSDYGDEGGVQVPHKIIRQVDDQVEEEWTITKVELNPDLEPEQFKDKRKQSRNPE